MVSVIKRYDASFTGINEPITLTIPRGSIEQAIRVYEPQAVLSVFVLQEFAAPDAPPVDTYSRTFQLILIDQPVPGSFKKYIATLPFGPGKIETHIVEV